MPGLVFAAGMQEILESLLAQGLALIQAGYQRAPILVLVLPALLILPVVAVISYIVRAAKRRRARNTALRAAQRRALVDWAGESITGTGAAASQAWITIEGKANGTMPLAGQVIRIGRHADNDIRLADSSVHRYHAVIQRTAEEAFVITDVSGKKGNGVRVNGQRLERTHLSDGDVIELGRAKLKFESAPA
jgi:FHA domain